MTDNAAELQLVEEMARCRKDPSRFVRFMYPWGEEELTGIGASAPRRWQSDVLEEIKSYLELPKKDRLPLKIAVSSGHGVGKSALIAWIAHWGQSTQADCKIVITANTETQLRTKTWPEVMKWYRLGMNQHWFNLSATASVSASKKHSTTWRTDCVPWSERNPQAFAGLHNKGKMLILIFDECSTIPDVIWEVAEGALTDENTDIIWVAFGNPTRNTGRFRDCFEKYGHIWKSRKIDSRTVEGTNKALFSQWTEAYGEESDFVRVRVRGEFPRAAFNQLISKADLLTCYAYKAAGYEIQSKVLGLDVARYGDDQSVLIERQGRKIEPPVRWRGYDTMQTAAKAQFEFTARNADAIMVDGTGVGGGVVDRLKQIMGAKYVIEVNNAASANEPLKFKNKRAEMYWKLAQAIKDGIELPYDRELEEELVEIEYFINDNGQIQIEPKDVLKERLKRSPDNADALAQTYAQDIAKYHKKRAKDPYNFVARYGSTGWMAC